LASEPIGVDESISRTIAPGIDSPVSASLISPLIENVSEFVFFCCADAEAKGNQSNNRKQIIVFFGITDI
jgi:hypothetical protein